MNTKAKRITGGIAAAAALALVPGIWYASTASAAMSPDTKRLCGQSCSINFPLSASSEGVNEGSGVKTTLQGRPGTYSVRVFIGENPDKENRATTLRAVGPVTRVTVKDNGYSEPTVVKVDPLKAPLTGGKKFTVQLADAKDAKSLVGGTAGSKDAALFTVNSRRALVMDTQSFANGSNFTLVQAGLQGDRFQMQIKDPKKGWVSITRTECVMNAQRTCKIEWAYPAGATPESELRVVNLANPNDAIWSYRKQGSGSSPKPTPDKTAKPTAKPTPDKTAKPTAKPTPDKTAKPTAKPTPDRTAKPTATPSTDKTAKPSPKPTTPKGGETPKPTTPPKGGESPKPTTPPKGGETPAPEPTNPPAPEPTGPTGPDGGADQGGDTGTPAGGTDTGTDSGTDAGTVDDGFGPDVKDSKETVGGLASTGF
ncbi:hypothetical protein CGZ98_19635 [Enemella evansiae]|uniref:hypothetical protein n=1 Tax=Enemella evansiae TaxID=2016499 RepID=UPI000B97BE57|nr:hypothetical protein [Enemella evansiae]OYO07128.1 hypothetical protein CGZ98_19635 [Enemella evansiae]